MGKVLFLAILWVVLVTLFAYISSPFSGVCLATMFVLPFTKRSD